MNKPTRYTYLHGLLGTNIDWNFHLKKFLGDKGDIFTPSIDYFQDPQKVRKHIKLSVSKNMTRHPESKNILLANSVGCHFGMDVIEDFDQAFFISPTYNFSRGSVSRTRDSIRSEVRKLFFDQEILNQNADTLEQESLYISKKLTEKASILALKRLKAELTASDYISAYRRFSEKIHIILGENDGLIPTDDYLGKHSNHGFSIDVIHDCSHVAPVERPSELREIMNKYGA